MAHNSTRSIRSCFPRSECRPTSHISIQNLKQSCNFSRSVDESSVPSRFRPTGSTWQLGLQPKPDYVHLLDCRLLLSFSITASFRWVTWGICTRRAGKLYKALSRLYRSQILQVNTRWKALAEIYTMHSFAPFSNRKIFVKNCWKNCAVFFCKFLQKISKTN